MCTKEQADSHAEAFEKQVRGEEIWRPAVRAARGGELHEALPTPMPEGELLVDLVFNKPDEAPWELGERVTIGVIRAPISSVIG